MSHHAMTLTRWSTSADESCLRDGFKPANGRPVKAQRIPPGRQT